MDTLHGPGTVDSGYTTINEVPRFQSSRVGMEPKIIKLQMSISDDDDDKYNYELCLQYTIINFKNGNNVHYQEILQGQREKLVEHEKRWRP